MLGERLVHPPVCKVREQVSCRCHPEATTSRAVCSRLAPVQELRDLFAAWLPGYEIICRELGEGGLAGEPREGESGHSVCCWERSEYI